jgi:ABC-2 type transport system permease protein
MKVWSITRKTLLELWREPMLWALLLIFPLAFIGLYDIAFNQGNEGFGMYLRVLIINEDAGAAMANGARWQAGETLIETLREVEFEGQPVFGVAIVTDRRAAEITLGERKASLLLSIPPDFSQSLLDVSLGVEGASPPVVSLVGDPASINYAFAQSFLDDMIRQFARQAAGWTETVTWTFDFLPGTGTMSDFDFGVPGLIVFGIMFIVITTAMTMVRENVNRTLQRLRLTRARASDLLLGVTLAQVVVALIQIPFTFGAALFFGFQNNGSLLLAMTVGLLLSVSSVGLGLITACFARNDGEAANLGGVVMVVMVLMSGAIYPMPDAPIATIAGQTIQLYDILPPTHASEAMRRILVLGEGAGALAYELAALIVLSVLFLAVGILLYQRLQMRKVH